MQSMPSFKTPNYLEKNDADKCQNPFRFIHRTTQIAKAISLWRKCLFTVHLNCNLRTGVQDACLGLRFISHFRMQWDNQRGAVHQLRGQQPQELQEPAQLQRGGGPHPLQLRLVSQAVKRWAETSFSLRVWVSSLQTISGCSWIWGPRH